MIPTVARDALRTMPVRRAGELPPTLREHFKVKTDPHGWVLTCKRCPASWLLTVPETGEDFDVKDVSTLIAHSRSHGPAVQR